METGLAKRDTCGLENAAIGCPPEFGFEAVRPRTILLVEDEAFVRDVIDEVLQSAGYRVSKTQNAEEALQRYQSEGSELDVLLSDVVMPGQNGRDLARQLRKQCASMRTILMSG